MHKTARQILAGLAAVCLGFTMIPLTPAHAAGNESQGTTYYVDEDGGNDGNSGTSEAQAWSSLEKVNRTEFKPGDRLLFQKGDTWTGQLAPKGSGAEGNPIVIGAYGEGDSLPRIDGNNWCGDKGDNLKDRIFNAAVFFYNQQYWEITSLEVTNRMPGDNPDDHIKKYGVLIMGEDAGTLRHMYTRDLYVHDVVSHPIGQQAGIGRGGIIYIIRGNKVETSWDDIVVENNRVGPNINHYGINFLSTWGSSRFEWETGIPDSEYARKRVNSTNIIIRNNYCKDIGNAAICPSAYSNVLIEHNTSDGCNSGPNGNVPIWWENGDYTVVQFNEVFGSGASETKEDSQAFDADVNAKMNIIQYNYTHDNPSGAYFECALGTQYTTHIRYNISENDGYGTNSYGGGAIVTIGGSSSGGNNRMYVYNNDFYLSEGHDSYITNSWDKQKLNDENFQFKNNLIYSDANSKGWHEFFKGTADSNAYGGSDESIRREDDANAVEVKASDFAGLGTGPDGYKIKENAGVIGKGTVIPGNGGLDYYGNPVSSDAAPNIGADNSFASVGAQDNGIDFEDRPEEETPLTGAYAGCTFLEGWLTARDKDSKVLYLEESREKGVITLPANQTLKSFQAYCSGTALVKLSGNGYEKTFNISPVKNTFDTGFASAVRDLTVTVVSPKGSQDVKFDNLVLEDAEYERNNLALNQYSWESGTSQMPPSNGNDGDEDSMWIHAGADLGAYWAVDLGKDYDLSDFELVFEQAEEQAWKYQVQGARDGSEYFDETPIYDAAENTDGARTQRGAFEPGTVYRWLLVRITGFPGEDYWPGFAEFRVYEREKDGVDKSALTDLIVKVKDMKQGNYTDESWNRLMEALQKAIQDYDTADTAEKVEICVKELQSAINRLTVNEGTNLALNKSAEASAPSYYGGDVSNGNDGDPGTLWIVNGDAVQSLLPQWWMVDLGREYLLSSYQLDFEDDQQGGAWNYKIEGSKNGGDFDLLEDKTDSPDGTRSETGTVTSQESYRYVRVTLTEFPQWDGADYWPAFAEFAIYGREVAAVDKELLEAKIIGAKTIGPDQYTPESFEALQQAIKAAEDMAARPDASQDEVDGETEKLEAAIKALEKKQIEGVKKNRISALLQGLASMDAALYTQETRDALLAAVAAAQEAVGETWYTQEMVDEKAALLEAALHGLMPADGVTDEDLVINRSRIRLAQAEALDAALYTAKSIKEVVDRAEVLRQALAGAKDSEATRQTLAGSEDTEALGQTLTDIEGVKQALADLETALQNLKDAGTEPEVNKDLLGAKLAEARAIAKDQYTDESYAQLQDAIRAASAVFEDEAALQEHVDEQMTLLSQAIDRLEKKQDPGPADPDPEPEPGPGPDGPGTDGPGTVGPNETPVQRPEDNVTRPGQNGNQGLGGQSARTGDEAPVLGLVVTMGVMVILAGAAVYLRRRKR